MSAFAFATPVAWPWPTATGSTATFALDLLARRLWPAPVAGPEDVLPFQ